MYVCLQLCMILFVLSIGHANLEAEKYKTFMENILCKQIWQMPPFSGDIFI